MAFLRSLHNLNGGAQCGCSVYLLFLFLCPSRLSYSNVVPALIEYDLLSLPHPPRFAMSNDLQKADQIAHRFYTKLCLVVSNARTTAEPRSQGKVDKWVRCSPISLCSLNHNPPLSSISRRQTLTFSRTTSEYIVLCPALPLHHLSNFRSCYLFPN